MNADREDRIEALKRQEERILNGSRGCPEANSDMLVEISRAMRSQLSTEFVTEDDCADHRRHCDRSVQKFGWPAAVTATGLIVAVTTLVLKFTGG